VLLLAKLRAKAEGAQRKANEGDEIGRVYAEIPKLGFPLATLVTLVYRPFGRGSYTFRALALAP